MTSYHSLAGSFPTGNIYRLRCGHDRQFDPLDAMNNLAESAAINWSHPPSHRFSRTAPYAGVSPYRYPSVRGDTRIGTSQRLEHHSIRTAKRRQVAKRRTSSIRLVVTAARDLHFAFLSDRIIRELPLCILTLNKEIIPRLN